MLSVRWPTAVQHTCNALLFATERERKAESKSPPRRGRKPAAPAEATVAGQTAPGKNGKTTARQATKATASRAPASSSAAANRSANANAAYNLHSALQETPDETGWTPSQKVALFNVQNRMDRRASNYWELVSEALLDLGFEKTAAECQQKWFEVYAAE
jgi:hypothetical protein